MLPLPVTFFIFILFENITQAHKVFQSNPLSHVPFSSSPIQHQHFLCEFHVPFYFLRLIESTWYRLYVHRYRVFYCVMHSLSRTTSLKKTDSPFPPVINCLWLFRMRWNFIMPPKISFWLDIV